MRLSEDLFCIFLNLVAAIVMLRSETMGALCRFPPETDIPAKYSGASRG